jgi:hypothetical protein
MKNHRLASPFPMFSRSRPGLGLFQWAAGYFGGDPTIPYFGDAAATSSGDLRVFCFLGRY